MDWREAQRLSQDAMEAGRIIRFVINDNIGEVAVEILPTRDGKKVWGIRLEATSPDSRLLAADVVQHFGYPRNAGLHIVYTEGSVSLCYPGLESEFLIQDSRLALYLPAVTITLSEPIASYICPDAASEEFGPWRGFASGEVYLARNRRDLRSKP
jgi:hypothetical protein